MSPLLLAVLLHRRQRRTAAARSPTFPPEYLALYRAAARRYGLDWAILAAIGKIETDHGRSTAPGVHSGVNSVGLLRRPDAVQRQGRHVGRRTATAASVYDLADAIPAAAR